MPNRARDGAPLRERRGHAGRHFVGAALAAIAQKLPQLPADAVVLGFNYDTGERYLSVEGILCRSGQSFSHSRLSFLPSGVR
jgi:hypothetical protein